MASIKRTYPMIEKATFEDIAAQLAPEDDTGTQRPVASVRGLHVCAKCGAALVHPKRWDEASDGSWLLELRCPECEWLRVDLVDDAQLAEFERELDRGAAELADDLASISHVNMAGDVDRLIRALHADAIYPIDF